MMTSIIQNNTI